MISCTLSIFKHKPISFQFLFQESDSLCTLYSVLRSAWIVHLKFYACNCMRASTQLGTDCLEGWVLSIHYCWGYWRRWRLISNEFMMSLVKLEWWWLVFRTDLSRYVQEVRLSRGNSLSGLTVQQIVSLVKEVIDKNQLMTQHQQRLQVNIHHAQCFSLTILECRNTLHFNLTFSQGLLCTVKFQVTLAMWTELCITV